jgi:hypothetical protein
MGAQDVLSRKTGVIVGDDVLALFKYAQEKKFAIPAIVSRVKPSIGLHTDKYRTSPHPQPSSLPLKLPATPKLL